MNWIGDRPFADAGGDALDGAVADVAGDEDAGDARFQQVGRAVEVPALRASAVAGEVQPAMTKPCSSRSTRPASQLVCGIAPIMMNSDAAGSVSVSPETIWSDGDPLQPLAADRFGEAGVGADLDVLRLGDAVDEVLAHAAAERRRRGRSS